MSIGSLLKTSVKGTKLGMLDPLYTVRQVFDGHNPVGLPSGLMYLGPAWQMHEEA